MKKFILFLITAFGIMVSLNAQVKVKNLRCENRIDPIGLDIPSPRFSWQTGIS